MTFKPMFMLLLTLAAHAAWAQAAPTAAALALETSLAEPALALPRNVFAALQRAGMDNKALHLSVRAVHAAAPDAPPALDVQGDQPAVLASTAKLVTALASLDLLGAKHRWRTRAYLMGPLRDGVLEGDLRIVGGGDALLTSEHLVAWFGRMRERGLRQIRGRILLDRQGFALKDSDHANTPLPSAEHPHHALPDAFTVDGGHITATLTAGPRGSLITQLAPSIGGLQLTDELRRQKSRCEHLATEPRLEIEAAASAASGPVLRATPSIRAVLRGDWSPACATLRVHAGTAEPGPLVAATVRAAWLASGGELSADVADTTQAQPVWPSGKRPRRAPAPWAVWDGSPLPSVLRDMNKWSDNIVARHLMLSLSPGFPSRPATLGAARDRLNTWLGAQGLSDGDLDIDNGSGLAIVERGKPHAFTRRVATLRRGQALH
jgi:serine-type D-Ala-D-Ala carboxypeptidase/endopeptidase (penicillin-binding protein 4)